MGKLLKAHFRKGKAGFVVFTVFITLAVFLLTVGLTLSGKVTTLFDEKEAEIDSPHMVLLINTEKNMDFSDAIIEQLDALEYIDKRTVREAAFVAEDTYFAIPGVLDASGVAFFNKDEDLPMTPDFSTETEGGEGVPLWFTYWFKTQNKVREGQKLKLKLRGTEYGAYVAGFYETVTDLYSGNSGIYTDGASYAMMKEMQAAGETTKDVRQLKYEMQFNVPYDFEIRSRFARDFERIYAECRAEFVEKMEAESPVPIPEEVIQKVGIDWGWYGVEVSENASEPYMLLLSVMMIVFSFVMTVIALIVASFLIRAGVEDDVKNLGVLKALGYTTNQLRQSYLALYGILVAAGAALGSVVAVLTMPVFEQILLLIVNLPMKIPANALAAFGSIAVVVLISLAVIWITTRRLKEITPLYALRGGISSHSFKKNSVPLETSKLGLNVTLGLKTVFQNGRQSVVSAVVAAVMSLITAFSFVMYYNMNVDKEAMVRMSGIETYDVGIYLRLPEEATEEDYGAIWDHVLKYRGVGRLIPGEWSGSAGWLNEDYAVSFRQFADYGELKQNPVYEGRNPELPTECAIPGSIQKALGLRIGDVIRLALAEGNTNEKITKEFTVVGFTQGLYLSDVSITREGYESLTDFDNSISYLRYKFLYFADDFSGSFDLRDFRENYILPKTKEMFPDAIENDIQVSITPQSAVIEQQVFSVVGPASSVLMSVIYVVTAIVVAAVIFMIIRMKMIREKRQIAISKAVGYTSFQLMHQTGLSMLLVALPAALIGGLVGGLLVNPFMSLIGGMLGLYKVAFVVHYGFIVLISLVLAALNYLVALLVSLSTRFITPRTLVSE